MTTIPSRVADIEPTLYSLLQNQTLVLDQFYLVLPRKKWQTKQPLEPYTMPPFLQSYADSGKINILRPEFDYGPVDKILHALLLEQNHPDCRLIYLDDDVIYDPGFVRNLAQKSEEHTHAAIGFSGTRLRSNFRQIAWRDAKHDRHPFLFYPISGTPTFSGQDTPVDILQGFTGVLVRPRFFHVPTFLRLVQDATLVQSVWKSDDFIISGYLESRGIRRILVAGGTFPKLNARPARTDDLGRTMHIQAMEAAYYLQSKLNIWKNFTFVDFASLSEDQVRLVQCEAGGLCESALKRGRPSGISLREQATRQLDKALLTEQDGYIP